jgi:dTDP-4-dehydrorhamnose reductase
MSGKVLVLGTSGQLGTDRCLVLAESYDDIGAMHSKVNTTAPVQLRKFVKQIGPTTIVNAAGENGRVSSAGSTAQELRT